MPERNDVHSQLNATRVASIARPTTLEELRATIAEARARGLALSMAGGCHAMGGQQFATDSINLDTTALTRVLRSDPAMGLLTIEAGADWPRIMDATRAMDKDGSPAWGIRQKQTGVDASSSSTPRMTTSCSAACSPATGPCRQATPSPMERPTSRRTHGSSFSSSRTRTRRVRSSSTPSTTSGPTGTATGRTRCSSPPTCRAMPSSSRALAAKARRASRKLWAAELPPPIAPLLS